MFSYIPNPPGTLPYKQSFGEVFGESMASVANTIAQYHQQKKQQAAQSVDVQIKLMQAGLGGDPKALIKNLKKAYDININEDSVRAMQVQAATRQQQEQEQMSAQTEQMKATAQLTQEKAKEAEARRQWVTLVGEAAKSGDYGKLAKAITQGQLAGYVDKGFDIMSMAALDKMTPEQFNKGVEARQTQLITGQDPRQLIQSLLADKQLVEQYGLKGVQKIGESLITTGKLPDDLPQQPDKQQIQQAMQFSEMYGVDPKTALFYTQHPDTIPPGLKPLDVEAQKKREELQQKEYNLRLQEFQEGKREFNEQQKQQTEQRGALAEEQKARTKLLNKQIEAFDEAHKDAKDQRQLGRELQYWKVVLNQPGLSKDARTEMLNQMSKSLGIDQQFIREYMGWGSIVPQTTPSAGAAAPSPSDY